MVIALAAGITYCLLGLAFQNKDFLQAGDCLDKSGGTISPQWFKDFAKVELPPSASNISATCEAGQDYVAYARLTINPADLNRLLTSSFIKTPLSSIQKPYDMADHYSDTQRFGWDLEAIASYLAGDASDVKHSLHQSILVDTSDASAYMVYIVTFG